MQKGNLHDRWQALQAATPRVRARDAARSLGVSEAELLACRAGNGVIELDGGFGRLIEALPALGEVMALTRNDHAVHEKTGRFDHVEIGAVHGLVVNRDIDLRLFMSHWRFGFAVEEPVRSGVRRSLQFFDADGTAVHKVYLRDASDSAAYEGLVEQFRRAEVRDTLPVTATAEPQPERPDREIDVAALRSRWVALRDTHEFAGVLRALGVRRLQALRLAGEPLALPLVADAVQQCLARCAAEAIELMCFVGNRGCIQIHTGPVSHLKTIDHWFNVLDPGFNLHLDTRGIASVWRVRKPTADGIVTSLEAYDAQGGCIVRFFGARKPGMPEQPAWHAMLESLPPAETGVAARAAS